MSQVEKACRSLQGSFASFTISQGSIYQGCYGYHRPLPRPAQRGKRFILEVVDFANRYPESVSLSNMEAETVVKAPFSIFSTVGFPKEILSDHGSNFKFQLFGELWRVKSALYHLERNRLVEMFNWTLTFLLRMHASKRGSDWDIMLPYLLFAYWEVFQESTSFAPFRILYGRKVRSLLDCLRDSWEGGTEAEGKAI